MATLEKHLSCNFDQLVRAVRDGIVSGSVSASLEDERHWQRGGYRCSAMVFERYSALGGNRLSLTVTLFGQDGAIDLCGIASGGSQAVFLKVNTLGESAFLDRLYEIVAQFE